MQATRMRCSTAPSATEREAERELVQHTEAGYRRLISDWKVRLRERHRTTLRSGPAVRIGLADVDPVHMIHLVKHPPQHRNAPLGPQPDRSFVACPLLSKGRRRAT